MTKLPDLLGGHIAETFRHPLFASGQRFDQCARLLRRPIQIHAHYRCNTKFAELAARCLVPCNRTESNGDLACSSPE